MIFPISLKTSTLLILLEREDRRALEKCLIEERRSEIYKNYKKSRGESRKGKLVFSDNTDELKQMLSRWQRIKPYS